jgi:hypothetical protein
MTPIGLPGGSEPGKCKILFAGGCHLDKTTPENQTTISTMAMRILAECGVVCEPDYLIQIRLAHFRRLERKCAEFRPDILVLQAGHPETNGLIAAYLVKRLGLTRYREAVSRSSSAPPMPFDSWRDRLKWRVRSTAKWVVHELSRRRLLDLEEFNAKLVRFFEHVAAAGVPRVIVVSPLPCADAVPMYYRQQAAPLFRAAARHFGFEHVSLIDLDNPKWHQDPTHLNQTGHGILGEALGRFLVCALLRPAKPSAGVDPAPAPASDVAVGSANNPRTSSVKRENLCAQH